MDIIRSGINTRLVTKQEYKSEQPNILDTRSLQNQSIMENIGQSEYDFNKLNNNINKKYESSYNKYLINLDKPNIPNIVADNKKFMQNTNATSIINNDIDNNANNKNHLLKIINKVLIKKNIVYDKIHLSKLIDTYNISYIKPQKNLLKQIINEISHISKTNDMHSYTEPNKIYKTTLISISSKDRDINKYPDPNKFTISLIENNRINNICSVQIISSIFPKNCSYGMNLEDYPYISIEISEFGSNYNSNNTFAQLTYDIDMGKFKKCISRTNDEYKKEFFPHVSIDKISISIKNSDNELYNFSNQQLISENIPLNQDVDGSKDSISDIPVYNPNDIVEYSNTKTNTKTDTKTDTKDKYMPVHFVFKITYIQEELTNNLSKNLFSDI